MSGSLLAAIMAAAALDSINPALFIVQLYLLATPRPVSRTLSYIAGVVALNFGGGVLLLAGLRTIITSFFTALNSDILYTVAMLLGLALIGFGLWLKVRAPHTGQVRRPRSPRAYHAFLLGAVVMMNEITTALPYFVAVERIATAHLAPVTNISALVLYNLVFSLPLFGFLLVFLALRQRFSQRLEPMNASVQNWSLRLLIYGSIAFGALLMADAATYFTTGLALFG